MSGYTHDVAWLVSEGVVVDANEVGWDNMNSLLSTPTLLHTITNKAFDAGGESVDRERLLGNVWTATPNTSLIEGKGRPPCGICEGGVFYI